MSKENDMEKGTNEEREAFNSDDSAREGAEFANDDFADATGDTSKVKFVNGNATDSVVDVDGKTRAEPKKSQFVGLSKSELMQYEKDPYWVKVRWVLLALFWLIWIGMLVAAVVIIVLAPKCPPRKDLKWWQESTVYQVYPRSFKDTDGDGNGDLKGINEKLDYLQSDLKTEAVYINPIFPSGNVDSGYDVTDYMAIDPKFGTLEDFDHLVRSMHKKEMKLILDFVPNHSSKDHPWFNASRQRVEPYTDYYVWAGDDAGNPPNNWMSVFGGSAWEWDDVRKQWYLHQFSASQPDLNVRNPAVQEELKKILLFWLKRGVDGFRIDAISFLFESADLTQDEGAGTGTGYDSVDHSLTTFQPETYEILTKWRAMIDELTKDDGKDRVLIVEAYATTANETLSLYNYNDKPAAHMPTNMALIDVAQGCDAACIRGKVDGFMDVIKDQDIWPNWQIGNHDVSRVASRMGNQELTNALNMLLMTLPGTAITYYGEEIGMHDVVIPADAQVDKVRADNRDPQRTPMQWSGDKFAGFSTGNSTWLPVADDYKERNVRAQFAHGAGITNLEIYQELVEARQKPSFQWGEFYSSVSEGVYFFVRQAKGFNGYLVAINFGDSAVTMNFPKVSVESGTIPDLGKIVATTGNMMSDSRAAEFAVGNEVTLDNVHIQPNEGFVFEWPPEAVNQQM